MAALERSILHELAAFNAFQPATLLWRAHELAAILRHGSVRGRVIDVGCGDGTVAGVLFGRMDPVPDVTGVEPDRTDAALASKSGSYRRVHHAPGDRIPEPDGSFDVAFSNSTLEHIDELGPVVAEMARLVRRSGSLLITVPSEEFHACLAGSAIVGWLAERRGRSYAEVIDQRLAHRRYPAPAEWHALLAEHGFEEVRYIRYLPKRAVRAWERISNATGGLAYELFAGRRSTREVQRRLGLVRRVPLLERGAVALLERCPLEPEIAPNEPSGGLLITARRAV